MASGKKGEFVFGLRPVQEYIESGKSAVKVFVDRHRRDDLIGKLLGELHERGIPIQRVPKERLNRITTANHQGVILITSAIDYQPLEELVNLAYEQGEDPLILVLDGVTDVRNLGAIGRSALAAGVHGMLLPVHGSAQVTADAIRTSSGALTKLPVSRTEDLEASLKYLSDAGLRLVAATEKGKNILYEQELGGPMALIMGSEDQGIHPKNLKYCDVMAHIPMKSGATASLNVSVAAGIFLFEIQRQRAISEKS